MLWMEGGPTQGESQDARTIRGVCVSVVRVTTVQVVHVWRKEARRSVSSIPLQRASSELLQTLNNNSKAEVWQCPSKRMSELIRARVLLTALRIV